jgi:hypothetical protein
MEDTCYPVFLNLKVPLLTKAFYYLFFASLIILVLFGIYIFPSVHFGDEIKASSFLLTTSEFQKIMFLFGLAGTPTFFILYKFVRLKKQGLLTLLSDKIEIDNHKTVTSYFISEITDIHCNDAMAPDGYPKCKLTIDFKFNSGKVTSVTLLDYSLSDQLMNTLLNYHDIKFDVTNFSLNPGILEMKS